MSTRHCRAARLTDVPALVALMSEFYAESGFPLATEPATRAFEMLIANSTLGTVWLLEADGEPAGYVVLTVCYAMEYGGLRGFVDDLYVRPSFRGRGLGGEAMAELRRAAAAYGVRALQVEVGSANDGARRLYARSGLVENGRLLLTLPLAPAVHEG